MAAGEQASIAGGGGGRAGDGYGKTGLKGETVGWR